MEARSGWKPPTGVATDARIARRPWAV